MATKMNGKRFLKIAIVVMMMEVAGSHIIEGSDGQKKIVSSGKNGKSPPFPDSQFQPAQGDSLGETVKAENRCMNGGVWVLRSFCACPVDYTGSKCEYSLKGRKCGEVPHLSWARIQECHNCRCYDGELLCLEKIYDGICKPLPLKPVRAEDFRPEDIEVLVKVTQETDTSAPYENLQGVTERLVLTNSGMSVKQGGGWCVRGVVMVVWILSALLTWSLF